MAEDQQRPQRNPGLTPRVDARRSRVRVRAALAGTGAIVVACGIAVAGSVWPAPSATRTVDVAPVALPAGQSVANCPGPARLLAGTGAGADSQFSPVSRTAATAVTSVLLPNAAGALPGATLAPVTGGAPTTLSTARAGAGAVAGKTTASNAVVSQSRGIAAPSVLRSDAVAGQPSALGGVLAFTADDGDLQGLAAVSCQTPANDAWLIGASTTVGRTGILLLSNTSTTAATVNLDLYGDGGALVAPGADGLLVPPHTVRSVVLAGLAANQQHVAVHLKSTGGPVAAVIQQSVLRGLVSGGVEFIAPTAAPAVRQVIPGVQVQDPALAAQLGKQTGYADATTALQVAVPGTLDAVVQVKVYGTGGQSALPNGGVFTAKAGSVTELPLSGLPAGSYTVDVRSEGAVTAAVRVVRGTKTTAPVDFGYAVAQPQLGDGQILVLPPSAASFLLLGVPEGHAKVRLVPVLADGSQLAPKTVEIGAATTVAVNPAQLAGKPVAAFVVSAAGDPVYGAELLVRGAAAGVSVAAIPRAPGAGQSVQVELRY